MTREEAIARLKVLTDYEYDEDLEALDMAIKALEQQPCEDLINQRATTCRHGGHCEWVACDKCNHYEPDPLSQQPCDDCISRQEAINCITSNEFRYKIVEDIKTLPSVTPKEKTGWIPVSERLPEDKTYVLTTIKAPKRIAHARSGWYDGGFFMNDNGDTWRATDKEVIAWMPLPEPYKAESEDKE